MTPYRMRYHKNIVPQKSVLLIWTVQGWFKGTRIKVDAAWMYPATDLGRHGQEAWVGKKGQLKD